MSLQLRHTAPSAIARLMGCVFGARTPTKLNGQFSQKHDMTQHTKIHISVFVTME